MSTKCPLSCVVVAGRDAALWLAVNAISRGLGPAGVTVVAVELPTRLRLAHVMATLPPLEALHAKLRLKESVIVGATGGSFSFGQNVIDLTRKVPGFFHAWGSYGAPIDDSAFFPCWLKAKSLGLDVAFQDFCPTAVAAKNGRMLLPDAAISAFGTYRLWVSSPGHGLRRLP